MSEQTTKSTSDESKDAPTEAAAEPTETERGGAEAVDPEAAALGTNTETREQASDDASPDAAPDPSPEVASDASPADASSTDEAAAEAPPEDGELEQAKERIATLEAEKAALDKEKQDYWNRVLRATADLENLRKRSRRDVEEARMDARTKVLREMLPVIDNLERALEHAEKTGAMEDKEASAVVEGVKIVLRQFTQALERCGVTPVDAVGKPFDPNLHEAIAQAESADQEPGTVVQALQRGYMIGERLLRPSMVVVAKAPPAPLPDAPSDADAESQATDEPTGSAEESAEAEAEVEVEAKVEDTPDASAADGDTAGDHAGEN